MQPLLQQKSNEYYIFTVSICRLSYLTCTMHVPYCHLWLALLYNIFPHYLINDMIKKKNKVTEHKMRVLILSTNFV